MSFGGGGSGSSSQPLTGDQRADILNKGVAAISQNLNALPFGGYTSPTYQPGMVAGDYNTMQQQLLKGGEAGLDYAKGKDLEAYNNDAAKRGIWSSGLALRGENDINAAYAPQYAAAGATAAGQAANLSQQNSAAQNAFNQANAQNQYNASWAPLNYLQGIFNQTGGTISNSSSGQGSLSI